MRQGCLVYVYPIFPGGQMKIKLFNKPKVGTAGDQDIVSFISGLVTIVVAILNSGLIR